MIVFKIIGGLYISFLWTTLIIFLLISVTEFINSKIINFLTFLFAITLFVHNFLYFIDENENKEYLSLEKYAFIFRENNYIPIKHESELNLFIKEINPTLKNRIDKIKIFISDIDEKIIKFTELKEKSSLNQHSFIDNKLFFYKNSKNKLKKDYIEIYAEIEKAYVIYQISELQNKDSLDKIRKKISIRLNTTLSKAKSIQNITENENGKK